VSRIRSSIAVAAILAASTMLPGCGADEPAPAALEGITRQSPLQVGSLVVPEVDADGNERAFSFRAAEDGLLFVYFGYTRCPDLCPTTFADFKAALARLEPGDAARVDAAFVTVDPDRDTPDIIVGYLGHFVDGGHAVRIVDPDLLAETEAAFGASSTVTTDENGHIQVSHTSIAYVVDHTGAVVVEWPFGVKPTAMAHDLSILLDRPEETS
jgi:protein SCO1